VLIYSPWAGLAKSYVCTQIYTDLSDTSNSSERVKESRVQMSEVKGQQKRKVKGALRALRAV